MSIDIRILKWAQVGFTTLAVTTLGCGLTETDPATDETGTEEASEDNNNAEAEAAVVETSTTFGEDGDDLMIRMGGEFWTLDADTGTALHHAEDSVTAPITVRDFLTIWYDLQDLTTQSATQWITYSCHGTGWTTYPTPHPYEVRKVLYDDGLAIDFLDPGGRGATYVFQGQNGPTDFLAGHTRIRRMEGGFSLGDGFRGHWTHLMDSSIGCIGTSETCNQGSPSHDLVLLLGGFNAKKTFHPATNCPPAGDPARTVSSIRFFVSDTETPIEPEEPVEIVEPEEPVEVVDPVE